MTRFHGLIGIALSIGLAFLLSNNRKAINLRVILSGLALQLALALFILKTSVGQSIFSFIARIITKVLDFAMNGADFVFGLLVDKETLDKVVGPAHSFIFMFKIMPTIIFVAVLV